MKDALGHGSAGNGAHSEPINNLPVKGAPIMSDATWHANMPAENYHGMIADLCGMWGGGGMTSAKLSPTENKQIDDAYAKRADWRGVAADIHAARTGTKSAPMVAAKGSARGEGWA